MRRESCHIGCGSGSCGNVCRPLAALGTRAQGPDAEGIYVPIGRDPDFGHGAQCAASELMTIAPEPRGTFAGGDAVAGQDLIQRAAWRNARQVTLVGGRGGGKLRRILHSEAPDEPLTGRGLTHGASGLYAGGVRGLRASPAPVSAGAFSFAKQGKRDAAKCLRSRFWERRQKGAFKHRITQIRVGRDSTGGQPLRHIQGQGESPSAPRDTERLNRRRVPRQALPQSSLTGIAEAGSQRLTSQERAVALQQVLVDVYLPSVGWCVHVCLRHGSRRLIVSPYAAWRQPP